MNLATWTAANQRSIAALLADEFGVAGRTTPLPGERDVNLRVDTADGPRLLKIMHAGCDPGLVDMQIAALEHVAARVPRLPVQRPVRTHGGKARTFLRDADGTPRCAWLVTFLPGRPFAERLPHDPALHAAVGGLLARLDRALTDFTHPALARELKWDLRRARWIEDQLPALAEPARQRLVRGLCERFAADWLPRLLALRTQPIHGDANDLNLLVAERGAEPAITGLLDFGDLHRGPLVAEVAVAAAYAMQFAEVPLQALADVVAGYHSQAPLQDDELALVLPLVLTRLCVSVVNSAIERRLRPEDPYVTVHEASAWRLLTALHDADPRIAAAGLRPRCGREAWPPGAALQPWLLGQRAQAAEPLGERLPARSGHVLDLSFESLLGGDDPEQFDVRLCGERIAGELRQAQQPLGIGRYGEPRPLYTGPAFGSDRPNGERRTRHLGVDLFAPAGTAVHAPLAGEVVRVLDCPDPLDYGTLCVLRHRTTDGRAFGTLYGHLARASVAGLRPGQPLKAGQAFAALGEPRENGGWPPHLHFQLIADDPAVGPAVPPGVAAPDQFAAAAALYPDPAWLLRLPAAATWQPRPLDALLADRRAHVGQNVRVAYATPVHLVRGSRHFLYDQCGRRHLDAYNNVPHVGHAHPRVAAAVQRQFGLLATNTRYVYAALTDYGRRLTQRLPPSLSVCFFVASGSEANELALRLSRAHTRRDDVLVMAHGYHGHTTGAMAVSPYKFEQPGGGGAKAWVHVSPQPDAYRGPHRGADAGARYAAEVQQQIAALQQRGVGLAAYLCECLPSVGGQHVLPQGFLPAVYAAVRQAGGVCIADDVQTALGRTGSHFWGFELAGAEPDVLVLGKPLGGGFPLGAVVTTPAIAESFARGPEFFSTFGGNSVACAAGIAVLEVLEQERLQDNARRTGEQLLAGLRELAARHAVIGDVRGCGLFLGVELVRDRDARAPAAAQARYVKDRLRDRRILIGTDGPDDNVLKIRPPMTFDAAAAEALVCELAAILREDGAQVG